MKRLRMLLPILMILLLAGCAGDQQELNASMHFTGLYAPTGATYSQFDGDVHVLITEHSDGQASVDIDLQETYFTDLDFQDEGNAYVLIHEDQNLPYYCVQASVYAPQNPNSTAEVIIAVDLEMEYLIILNKDLNLYSDLYYVAASNPDAVPREILQHFEKLVTLEMPVTPPQVDYVLHASVITADGHIKETFDISMIDDVIFEHRNLYYAIGILTPETFRYQHEVPTTELPVVIEKVQRTLPKQPDYFVWRGYSYDRETGEYRLGCFAYSHAENYLIISWDDDEQEYLIASWTPQPAQKLLTYFQTFIDRYSYEK